MKISVISLFLFLLSLQASAQFPENWEGKWKGELSFYNEDGLQKTVSMSLEIAAKSDSSWIWNINYGNELRAYTLYAIPISDNNYILDQHNGVRFSFNYMNSGFYSWFGTSTDELLMSYDLMNGKIHFKTIASENKELVKKSNDPKAPEIFTQKVKSVQQAVLSKIE